MSQIKTLPLNQIRIDGGTQPRLEIDEGVVAEYAEQMENGDQFAPAIVFFDGTNNWLADGFHRFHAANKAGLAELLSDVRQGTRRDAVLYSVGANSKHGLRRSVADKRRAVETLLKDEEWRQFGVSSIATHANVSRQFVYQVMNDNPHLSTLTSENRKYIDKHGNVSTMNTANIGHKSATKVPQIMHGKTLKSMRELLNANIEIGESLRDTAQQLNDDELFSAWVKAVFPQIELSQVSEYVKLADMAQDVALEERELFHQMHKAMQIDEDDTGMLAVA